MSLAKAAGSARMDAGVLGLTNHAVFAGVSGLFVLPSAIFALSLRPIAAALVIVGCLAAFAIVVSGQRSTEGNFLAAGLDAPRLLLAIGVAAGLLVLGGETHLFYATPDWQVRDAVLADLVRHGFPVTYTIDGKDDLLRAPLGMYIVPAAVGHALGLAAAHAALLAQNALLLGSTFYLMMGLGRGWPHLVLLVLFGGASVVGALIRDAMQPAVVHDYWRWSLDSWHPNFQFSSAMVQFFWVPNHALPGWWLALLFLLQRRSTVDAATLGVCVAALAFWSPLAAIPALPWLAWQACTEFKRTVVSLRTLAGLAAAACFAPILIYMVAASGSISHGSDVEQRDFGLWYALFILIQLPALAFLAICWRNVPRDLRALLLVNGLVLLALPFFRFGPHNDLVMRGSVAPLAIVGFAFGLVLLDLTRRRALIAGIGWIIAAGSASSAVVELRRAITMPRYQISDCTLMQASRELDGAVLPTNYVAPIEAVPPWIIDRRNATVAAVEPRECWPDLPH